MHDDGYVTVNIRLRTTVRERGPRWPPAGWLCWLLVHDACMPSALCPLHATHAARPAAARRRRCLVSGTFTETARRRRRPGSCVVCLVLLTQHPSAIKTRLTLSGYALAFDPTTTNTRCVLIHLLPCKLQASRPHRVSRLESCLGAPHSSSAHPTTRESAWLTSARATPCSPPLTANGGAAVSGTAVSGAWASTWISQPSPSPRMLQRATVPQHVRALLDRYLYMHSPSHSPLHSSATRSPPPCTLGL